MRKTTSLWRGLTFVFSAMLSLSVVASVVMEQNRGEIDGFFNTHSSQVISTDDGTLYSAYTPDSEYLNQDGTGNSQAVVDAHVNLNTQLSEEGSVLLKNTGVLPLSKESKVTLLGIRSHVILAGSGMGVSAKAGQVVQLEEALAEKYEIGSHTMNHQLVWQQSPTIFKEDIESSIKLLEDITGKKVLYFRAPGFSIRRQEAWAFEILHDMGIVADCSVFPAHHAHGGIPEYTKAEPSIICHNQICLKEFPISVKHIMGKPVVYSGGGYFRLFPYSLIQKWVGRSNYVMTYIHPRDLDVGQPMIKDLPLQRKFKSYVGLKGAEKKLYRLLADFHFMDIQTAMEQIDWRSVPRIVI